MAEQNTYGIFLTEGSFGDDFYAYSFQQKELADWISAPVVFPDGVSSLRLQAPGFEGTIGVTIGSPANDKLLGLLCVAEGRPHPWLIAIEEQEDEEEAYEELLSLCGSDQLFEGLIY